MIFSSSQFILVFLPVVFFGYFYLNNKRLIIAGKLWLTAMSLFFYAYWNLAYLPILLISIAFNFIIGSYISPKNNQKKLVFSRYKVLVSAVSINLGLLVYFKYTNFIIQNINGYLDINYNISQIILPLGISFFTFTQIAYLVDSYRGKAEEYNLINYGLFVTFFPHLIAGPIIHHREMMSQFQSKWTLAVRYRNILSGLFIFSIGLFKKVILADTFAIWANAGFDNGLNLDFFSAWATSLSYTFQLYFDFSGYCDMAIGASLLFNIWLPINFNSPYKSLNIQDFWRRWHITLSRFLRDYLYIPLGGNRCSNNRGYLNIVTTFVLGGLWHGASWMFVIWGSLHGLALVIHRVWQKNGFTMKKNMAWFLTFMFINISWVFFRAKNINDAFRILLGMIDIQSSLKLSLIALPSNNLAWGGWFSDALLKYLPTGLVGNLLCYISLTFAFFIIAQKNAFQLMENGVSKIKVCGAVMLFSIAIYGTMITKSSVFLYFNF